MAEIRVAPDESFAELVLAPGERLATTSFANVLLARAGVRVGVDHAALAALADVEGPAAVRVAAAGAGRSVMGRALPTAEAAPAAVPAAAPAEAAPRPVAALNDVSGADGLVQVAGDLRVAGDVGLHAVIAALGDVTVGGDLAGGRVLAGGKVVVMGAIRRESVVEAGGDVTAASVEAAAIRTDGTLVVAGDVIRAVVEAAGLRVGGTCESSEIAVAGEIVVARPPAEAGALRSTGRPRPRAASRAKAARRADAEAQLARLRPMLGAAAVDAPTKAKVASAIASLEARLREL